MIIFYNQKKHILQLRKEKKKNVWFEETGVTIIVFFYHISVHIPSENKITYCDKEEKTFNDVMF